MPQLPDALHHADGAAIKVVNQELIFPWMIQECVPSLHHRMEHTTSTTASCLGDSSKVKEQDRNRIRMARGAKSHLNQDESNHYESSEQPRSTKKSASLPDLISAGPTTQVNHVIDVDIIRFASLGTNRPSSQLHTPTKSAKWSPNAWLAWQATSRAAAAWTRPGIGASAVKSTAVISSCLALYCIPFPTGKGTPKGDSAVVFIGTISKNSNSGEITVMQG